TGDRGIISLAKTRERSYVARKFVGIMTPLPLHRKLVVVGALVLATCCTGFAQLPNLGMGGLGGKNDGMSTDFLALARLFGSNTTFTAKLDMRVYKDQK